MYLVIGATGQTGSAVTRALLQRGRAVRALVRDPARAAHLRDRGVELTLGTLDDAGSVTAALQGVEGVYLMLPQTPASADFVGDGERIAAALRQAVDSADVPRVVGLSSIGAHLQPPIGVMEREGRLEAAFAGRTNTTFLRPAYFVENWRNVLEAVQHGVLPTFLGPEVSVDMVGVADIGDTAARLLTDGGPPVVELAGPAPVTVDDVAVALAAALDRPIQVDAHPPADAVPMFEGIGFTTSTAEMVRDMYEHYNAGTLVHETEPTRTTTPLSTAIERMLAA